MPQTLVLPDVPASAARPGSPPPLRATLRDGGLDKAWVHLAGELNLAAVPALEQILREARRRARLVVLDLRALASIDGFGVHAIVTASTAARSAGHRLILVRGSSHVQRSFTLTGTAHALEMADIEPSLDDALAQLSPEEPAATTVRPAKTAGQLRRVVALVGANCTTIGSSTH